MWMRWEHYVYWMLLEHVNLVTGYDFIRPQHQNCLAKYKKYLRKKRLHFTPVHHMVRHVIIIIRRGSRIQKGGFVQEFRLENRSYPDVHDFSLRMQVIIAND